MGKGENAGNQQKEFQFFGNIYFMSANAFNLDQSKILSFCQELNPFSQSFGHL